MPKTNSLFCHSQHHLYYWEFISKDTQNAKEIGDILLCAIKQHWDNTQEPSTIALPDTMHTAQPSLHISLAHLRELDHLSETIPIPLQFETLKQIIVYLKDKILNKGFKIGIEFSEVFFVKSEQDLPDYYHPETDRVVTTASEYRRRTGLFSYQFTKALLSNFKPHFNAPTQTFDKSIKHFIYTVNDNYQTPTNYITHSLELNFFLQQHSYMNHIVLRLGPQMLVSDLEHCNFSLLAKKQTQEVIILLHGCHYQETAHRQHVAETIIAIAAKQQWLFFPRVCLLTKPGTPNFIYDLDIEPDEQAGFCPIKDHWGYYLSDARLNALIYRHLQDQAQETRNALSSVFQESQEPFNTPYQPYIIHTGSRKKDYRRSKDFNAQQLKDHISFTVTQQYEQAQTVTQVAQQAQNHTQQQALTQTIAQQTPLQRHVAFDSMRESISFQSFSGKLKLHADKMQLTRSPQDVLLRHNHYLTNQGYATDIIHRLSTDPAFRNKVTGSIFRRFHHVPNLNGLRTYSFVQMDRRLAEQIIEHISGVLDGLDEGSLQIEQGMYMLTMIPLLRLPTLVACKIRYQEDKHTLHIPHLSILTTSNHNPFLNRFPPDALLRREALDALSPMEQALWLHRLGKLIDLFQTNDPSVVADQSELRQSLCALIEIHGRTEDRSVFNSFLNGFPTLTHEHCRLILYPIIHGYRQELEQFLILLDRLEQRNLLVYFRKIYSDYAQNICVISDLLQTSHFKSYSEIEYNMAEQSCDYAFHRTRKEQHLFLEIAQRIPVQSHPTTWPPFETFALHFLLSASRLNLNIQSLTLKELEIFWHRIDDKLFKYHQEDRTKTDDSMRTLTTHLICPDQGLVLAPVCQAKTIFSGVEKIIDAAIRHHTVLEQIQEWRGLSLLATDAVYAAVEDDFEIVTEEMVLELNKLRFIGEVGDTFHYSDSFTTSYKVSAQTLKLLLNEQCMVPSNYPSLNAKIFRYLGGESLREPIQYYRVLQQYNGQQKDEVYVYFRLLLLGYFVLNSTGEHYTQSLDHQQLHDDFIQYILTKNYIPPNNDFLRDNTFLSRKQDPNQAMRTKITGEYSGVIQLCVQDFCLCLRSIVTKQQESNLQHLWAYYSKTLAAENHRAHNQSSLLSWIPWPQAYTFETIPAVFKRSFSLHHPAAFFLIHKEALLHSSAIFAHYPGIINHLIASIIKDHFAVLQPLSSLSSDVVLEKKQFLYRWIIACYPTLTIDTFIHDVHHLENFISGFAQWVYSNDHRPLYKATTALFEQHLELIPSLFLLRFITQQTRVDGYTTDKMLILLRAFQDCPSLIRAHATSNTLLNEFSSFYFAQSEFHALKPCLFMIHSLLVLEERDALKTLQVLLGVLYRMNNPSSALRAPSPHVWREGITLPFFLEKRFSGIILQRLATLLSEKALSLKVLFLLWQDNPKTDFVLLEDCDSEHCALISLMAAFIHDQQPRSRPMLEILNQCQSHTTKTLKRFLRLRHQAHRDPQDLLRLTQSTDLKQDLKIFEQETYAKHLERFTYDVDDIKNKIALIRRKSIVVGDEDTLLRQPEQQQLLTDYQTMMSYMQNNPVFYVYNELGEQTPLCIAQLDDVQCPLLYQQLASKLKDASINQEKKHAYRLVLLALCCEAHFRITDKFPQNTQILCELHALSQTNNQIQEVKTGGGKSIITEIRAVLLCAEGWTIDMATENKELANVALKEFKDFYEYLSVPHAQEIIQSNSSRKTYVDGGINHSTPADLSFFRIQMAIKKQSLPARVALLCDEIDALLTATTQFRLAGVLDPIYADVHVWKMLLTTLLEFVKEDEIFLSNPCDDIDDVHNFKTYLCLKQTDASIVSFIEKVPLPVLDALLNAARIPQALQAEVDYLPLLRQHNQTKKRYATPILNVGTKRPDPSVSYADGVQQLLHLFIDLEHETNDIPFLFEAITETLLIMSTKNFLDFYSLIMGWTGTPGSTIELLEFFQEHRLTAHYYPVFHPDRSLFLGTHIVDDRAPQHEAVLTTIREQRTRNPGQPILVFLDTPKAVHELEHYFATHAEDLIHQSYLGYECGVSEEDIIQNAGDKAQITLTTLSLSRGSNFKTSYPQGYLGINCAADITEEESVQIDGRIARNGHPGHCCNIICAMDLNSESVSIVEPNARFKVHQQSITLKRQTERLKTRFLEDTRHHIIMKYFFKLREDADSLLSGQYGLSASVMPEKDFLCAIRDFNKYTEHTYLKMLGTQTILNDAHKKLFLTHIVEHYQAILDRLIPEQSLQHFNAVEPMVALASLDTIPMPAHITLRELTALSAVLSYGWKAAGNQFMVTFWDVSDDILTEFQPYFNHECSFRVAAAEVLERRHILNIPKIIDGIDTLTNVISEYNWQEAVAHVERDINSHEERTTQALSQMFKLIFTEEIIEHIKTYLLGYIADCKLKISEKRWDDLSLPDLNIPWIQAWLSRIQTLFTVFSYATYGAAFVAGPIPFILTRFILPTVLSWIKTMVKRVFADSESVMLQVLIGLDDAFADIHKAVTILFTKDVRTLTIDEFLNNIAPLLKNKAIQLILNKLSDTSESGQVNPYFQLLPDIFNTLEPYRSLPMAELKNPEIIVKIVITCLQSDLLKQMMSDENYAHLLLQLQALPSDFAETFKDCSLPQLMHMLKILAHPKFYQMIQQLPPDEHFSNLITYLQTETAALPVTVQNPIKALRLYQDNHERMAQEAQHHYRNIKQIYSLRIEDIENHQARSHVPLPHTEPSQPNAFWQIEWTKLMISYTVLLLANYLLFGFSLLWISVLFVSLLSYPLISQLLPLQTVTSTERFLNGVIPPFIIQSTATEEDTRYTIVQHERVPPEKHKSYYPSCFLFNSSSLPIALPDGNSYRTIL